MSEKLENLPDFEEGAKSELKGHKFFYEILKNRIARRCGYCTLFEFRSEYLPAFLVRTYTSGWNLGKGPKIVEDEKTYCKKRSIELAKIKGTFNPEYEESFGEAFSQKGS